MHITTVPAIVKGCMTISVVFFQVAYLLETVMYWTDIIVDNVY